MGEFTLIGRQTSGANVIGYVLISNTNRKILRLSKEEVYKLAMEKKISDVVAQEYNGRVNMRGTKYKISSLPNYDDKGKIIDKETKEKLPRQRILLTTRLTSGKNTIGYGLTLVQHGGIIKEVMLSREKVMELAKKGFIDNARYQSSNGKDILRGVGCNINGLPTRTLPSMCVK